MLNMERYHSEENHKFPIFDDLKVEDELDAEVRKILEGYTQQMRQQNIEYHEMFQMIKRKLIKERNLVL